MVATAGRSLHQLTLRGRGYTYMLYINAPPGIHHEQQQQQQQEVMSKDIKLDLSTVHDKACANVGH